MLHSTWIRCPSCCSKTRVKVRFETVLLNFPLYCPKCRKESIISVIQLKMVVIKGNTSKKTHTLCEKVWGNSKGLCSKTFPHRRECPLCFVRGETMKRTAILLLLAFCLLISTLPLSAFAEETTEPVTEDPIDEIIEHHHSEVVYIYKNQQQHDVYLHEFYWDNTTGTIIDSYHEEYQRTENHYPANYVYTGNNFHSGNRHYFQYSKYCKQCGATITKWESAICPGNGHCIDPV